MSYLGIPLFNIFTYLPLYNNYLLPVLARANFFSFAICFLIFIFQLAKHYQIAFLIWQSIRENKRQRTYLIRRIFDAIFWNTFYRLYYLLGAMGFSFGSYVVINQQWIEQIISCHRLVNFCSLQYLLLIIGNYIMAVGFFFHLFFLFALYGRKSDLNTYGDYDDKTPI